MSNDESGRWSSFVVVRPFVSNWSLVIWIWSFLGHWSLVIGHSESPRPFLRPSFDDHFCLGEKLDGVAGLAVKIAEEALAGTAERKKGHRRRDADIDADVPDLSFTAEFAGAGAAAGEQAR